MRIGHISDIHLGYTSGNKVDPNTKINLREQDGYNALNECIDQMIEQKVDIVLCTGDFFHSPAPTIYTIVQAQESLRKLSKAKIPFYNLAGNHDATDSVKDIPANRVLHYPELNLFSYTEPYIIQEIEEDIVLHLVSHHSYTEQIETMREVAPLANKFNILCTHGSCYDEMQNGVLHTESSPREVIVPENVLKLNWDYILMGHIHERGWVSSTDGKTDTSGKKRFYGGSTIRRGFSDKECKLGRGWTLWTIENNQMTPEFFTISQRPQFEKIIKCENKTIIAIEKDIITFFESINLAACPIVRIILLDLTSKQKLQMNWKKISEYTSKCLTFSSKVQTIEEVMNTETSEIFSFDLYKSYEDFWDRSKENYKNIETPEKIKKIGVSLLKQGQDAVLGEKTKTGITEVK